MGDYLQEEEIEKSPCELEISDLVNPTCQSLTEQPHSSEPHQKTRKIRSDKGKMRGPQKHKRRRQTHKGMRYGSPYVGVAINTAIMELVRHFKIGRCPFQAFYPMFCQKQSRDMYWIKYIG